MTAPHSTATLRALGHRFRIEGHDADAIDYVRHLFSALPEGGRTATVYTLEATLDGPHRLLADGEVLRTTGCFDRVLAHLLWHVNQEATARTDGVLLLHAGAVAEDDRAVLLPAASGAGKSTLVAALVDRGYGYITDELAALDPRTWSIEPYPKPISVGLGSWPLLPSLHPTIPDGLSSCVADEWYVVPPRETLPRPRDRPRPVAIVWPSYEPGGVTRIEPVEPATMVAHLMGQTFRLRDDLERNFRALAELADTVPSYRLTVGELSSAASAVAAVLSGGVDPSAASVSLPVGPG